MKYLYLLLLIPCLGLPGCYAKSSHVKEGDKITARIAANQAKHHPDDISNQTAALAREHASQNPGFNFGGIKDFLGIVVDAVGSGGGIGAIGTALFGGLSLFLNRKRKRTKLAAFDAAKEPDREKAESILKEAKI